MKETVQKKIRVRVTRKHIENGMCCDAQFCPIALAAREAGVKFGFVRVCGLYAPKNCKRRLFTFPPRIQKCVKRYDAGMPVKPINFIMERE